MADIYPFRALMPEVDNVCDVAAVPYDVVDRDEAAALADGKPLSFLRVSRPEIELPEDLNPYDESVYQRAADNFVRLIDEAPLKRDSENNIYFYALTMGDHRQCGIVAASSVDDYDNDIIKKHEKTRQDKEDDRTKHTVTIRAHSGPVFLLYRENADVNALLDGIEEQDAHFDFTAEDGVRHQVWKLGEALSEKVADAFKDVSFTYVADGHHRAKSASRTREACRSGKPDHDGSEAYNRFLSVLFPHNQLKILAYNRIVHDLNGLDKDAFMARIAEDFEISDNANPEPAAPGTMAMYLDGSWYGLKEKVATATDSVADSLDVSVLQNKLLAPVLGIDDPRTSKRIEFIGGIHGTGRLEELVEKGRAAVAFSMHPTTVEQLMGIADQGEIMPPKSTWFEPKLRDGLLIHTF